ncbi:FAD/NAD(P)-binding protein [Pollutibacter soli]|uniref:FAD/NAD(P)-binding protein n=1 Tax=Pollutibacter soli TaxID=3034157 RepID=UPI003013A407
MHDDKPSIRIALLGGGPAALYMFKRIVESGRTDVRIHIYERKSMLGAGMPYSEEGANTEHLTNISDVEIPKLETTMEEWLPKLPEGSTKRFGFNQDEFHDLKVIPRLLFGKYLADQFQILLEKAKNKDIPVSVHLNVEVQDVKDDPEANKVKVITGEGATSFDHVVLCTGHQWPKKYEGKVDGYYDSPYPPSKISKKINYPVAIKGSSLTAFDAIRTLSRCNGRFTKDEKDVLGYQLDKESNGFKMVMHSIDGLLPTIRMHVDEKEVSKKNHLSKEEMLSIREKNGGFIPLDWLYEEKFKESFKKKDPEFYKHIKNLDLETFVESIMSFREKLDPFSLFRAEYDEAEKSIRKHNAIAWKELIADLNYTINYPAKYFSAEDMLRLKKVLMPLISIIIAFVPQNSAQELIALHEAGVLSVVAVDRDSKIEPDSAEGITYHYTDENGKKESKKFRMFIDCVGQPLLEMDDLTFGSLVEYGTVSPARIRFRSIEDAEKLKREGNKDVVITEKIAYLKLPGIMINDDFQVVDNMGVKNNRVYVMAVPLIGGLNPDYSGLDFCDFASTAIVKSILKMEENKI